MQRRGTLTTLRHEKKEEKISTKKKCVDAARDLRRARKLGDLRASDDKANPCEIIGEIKGRVGW